MLIKWEPQSVRVKGIAFHPRRRWVLTSLHSGAIKLWDYGEKVLIDQYEEHKGPVRGLDFHPLQPIFVSGGDDAKIKVWNYKSKKCLFTLDAHEDYIRTTFFHHEHPWILSASDDQSIRIWNWQSRSKVTILTGHAHYVMCAQFHPAMEQILSASIDQTLRIWDISGLKTKTTSSSPSSREEANAGLPEILSRTDYSVESKDAHNSEINWCAYHPNPAKQLCLSAADDSHVKIWRTGPRNELREIDTLRGHYNNVNCAIFHPRRDLIVTASEDKSVKVWDLEKRTALGTHRREYDRFWTLAAHPKENLFAAGHDSGFTIFKLERERPAFTIVKDVILFIKGKQLCKYNMKTHDKKLLIHLKPKTEMTHYYHAIHCYSYENSQTNQVLVSVRSNNVDKGVCDLYKISQGALGESCEPVRSQGLTGLFIGPNRYAVLDRLNKVIFKVNNEERKSKFTITANEIFFAGPGRLLTKSDAGGSDTVAIWDIEKGCEVASLKVEAKRVIMSDNKNFIACIGKKKITICDGHLKVLSTIHEQRRIKSAAWEESGVLIYSTPVHVKYALSDGHTTTIVSVRQTLYIMAVRDDKVFCIDRNCDVKQIPVDSREFKFKQAVIRNDRGAILSSLRQLGSLTRAEISFLVKKGYPGLALKFVKDDSTRFPLALQAYDIEEALQAASRLDDRRCWSKLAEVAMEVGHVKAAERAYKELKKPYKLAMLYLVTGQRDKMLDARVQARSLGDTSTEFIISLLVKDFVECTHIIRRCGHPNLAYAHAVNHGLYELAEELREDLTEEQLSHLPSLDSARNNTSWMQKTIPDIENGSFENWPLLNDEQDNVEAVLAADEPEANMELDDTGDWEDDEFKSSPDRQDEEVEPLEDSQDDEGGWDDDEPLEDLLDEDDDTDTPVVEKGPQFSAPNPGQSITAKWLQKSDLALHHVLAGSYKSALTLLHNQVGAVNSEQLKDIIKDLVLQSRAAYRGLALYPTMYIYPTSTMYDSDIQIPAGGYKIEDLTKRLNESYSLFSTGKFADAIVGFRNLLSCVLFMQTVSPQSDLSTDEMIARAKEIISVCREYILGLQIWLERKGITGKEFEDHKRSCELMAYFAKLNLAKHRSKVLEKAFEVYLVKPKKFQQTRAAVSIARRLLDYISTADPRRAKLAAYAEKVKSGYDALADQEIDLDYDDLNPYSLCASTFKPIYSGNQLTECPLCDAKYKPEYKGSVCKVCQVSQVGKRCPGIKFQASEFLYGDS